MPTHNMIGIVIMNISWSRIKAKNLVPVFSLAELACPSSINHKQRL